MSVPKKKATTKAAKSVKSAKPATPPSPTPVPQSTFATREAWLQAAVVALRPLCVSAALDVPALIHVSVGWPSRSALSAKRQRLGECWYGETSQDGHPQLFISPVIADSHRVLDVLLHELLHTALPKAKHGPKFAKAAKAVGLEGKPTTTVAGADLLKRLGEIVKQLGPMPHAGLTVSSKHKVQSTRLLKACAADCCGYIVRVTKKWIDDEGCPLCPHGATMEVDV